MTSRELQHDLDESAAALDKAHAELRIAQTNIRRLEAENARLRAALAQRQVLRVGLVP